MWYTGLPCPQQRKSATKLTASVPKHPVQLPVGISSFSSRPEQHNVVTAKRPWNSGCSKYLQKFSGDIFPTKGVFFSVSPLLWLTPLYLSLNQIYFPYVTIWLAFTLPVMERKGSVKEKGISLLLGRGVLSSFTQLCTAAGPHLLLMPRLFTQELELLLILLICSISSNITGLSRGCRKRKCQCNFCSARLEPLLLWHSEGIRSRGFCYDAATSADLQRVTKWARLSS